MVCFLVMRGAQLITKKTRPLDHSDLIIVQQLSIQFYQTGLKRQPQFSCVTHCVRSSPSDADTVNQSHLVSGVRVIVPPFSHSNSNRIFHICIPFLFEAKLNSK